MNAGQSILQTEPAFLQAAGRIDEVLIAVHLRRKHE
jgi:hypothetical protein